MAKAIAEKILDDACIGTTRLVDSYRLGSALLQLRKQSKKKQNEVAHACGVTASFLGDCERGFRRLTDDRVLKYVEACQ